MRYLIVRLYLNACKNYVFANTDVAVVTEMKTEQHFVVSMQSAGPDKVRIIPLKKREFSRSHRDNFIVSIQSASTIIVRTVPLKRMDPLRSLKNPESI